MSNVPAHLFSQESARSFLTTQDCSTRPANTDKQSIEYAQSQIAVLDLSHARRVGTTTVIRNTTLLASSMDHLKRLQERTL